MSQKQAFHSDSKFWAREYFPKGIGRSGHFNKTQAVLLETHGKTYQALSEGSKIPEFEEEKAFVEVCRGERAPESEHEKTWCRFLDVTDQKNRVHYSVGSSSAPSVDFSSPDEVE